MKTETNGYRNPLLMAQPVTKGRITGLGRLLPSKGLAEAGLIWSEIRHGERRDVAAGSLVHVRGAAGRVQSFLFEEDGSVEGPVMMAFHIGNEIGFHLRGQPRFPRPAKVVVMLATLAFAALLLWIGPELRFWSPTARIELIATLTIGWVVICVCAVLTVTKARRSTKPNIEITPPRHKLS